MGLQERWNISSFSLNRIGQCTCLPAWQFAAGYAQLHGFALPHGAETARRCVKHSLLERPGPKGLSPLQAQGLFGSRMGRFSTFCVSKVEKKSLSLSLYLYICTSTYIRTKDSFTKIEQLCNTWEEKATIAFNNG